MFCAAQRRIVRAQLRAKKIWKNLGTGRREKLILLIS